VRKDYGKIGSYPRGKRPKRFKVCGQIGSYPNGEWRAKGQKEAQGVWADMTMPEEGGGEVEEKGKGRKGTRCVAALNICEHCIRVQSGESFTIKIPSSNMAWCPRVRL
jgi:hypothetical protein